MLDKTKFNKLMVVMCEIFNSEISDIKNEVYYDSLKDFQYERIEVAIRSLLKTHKYNFLPKPADIIETIKFPIIEKKTVYYKLPYEECSKEEQEKVQKLISETAEKMRAKCEPKKQR